MKNERKRAFSLVELLIALVVMGIVTAGAVSLFGTGSTLMSRQVSSSTRLTTERFTLDGIYNELRKGSIASLDILNTNDPQRGDSFDKAIFLQADGNGSFRAILREWSATGVPTDTPLTGADGIRSLDFRIPTATVDTNPDNFMLSVDVVAARVNNTEDGVAPRVAHRKVGFFGQTVKSGDVTGTVYAGNAVRFAFFVPAMLAAAPGEPVGVLNYVVDGEHGNDNPAVVPANHGRQWGRAAFKTVNRALDAAAADTDPKNKVVWVKKGTYTLGATLNLAQGVKLYGGFTGTENISADLSPESRDEALRAIINSRDITANRPILSGNKSVRVILCSGDSTLRPTSIDTVLDGFEIADGKAADPGGAGMYNYYADPLVTNCTFSGDKANTTASDSGGGGMRNENSSPTVTNCTFLENSAIGTNFNNGGGGMYNRLASSPTVTNCIFSSNTGSGTNNLGGGGGMFNDGDNANRPAPVVANCTFSGNSGSGADSGGGGGMKNYYANPVVTNCTFSGNSGTGAGGGGGGGMYNFTSSPTVTNCTFSENSGYGVSSTAGGGGGGGMYNNGSSPTITNCTFSGNSGDGTGSDSGGGGMYVRASASSSTVIKNTIFWGNDAKTNNGHEIYRANPPATFTTAPTNSRIQDGANFVFPLTWNIIAGTVTSADPKIVSVDRHGYDATTRLTHVSADLPLTSVDVYIYKLTSIDVKSSAIDRGTVTGAPTTDQRGVARWDDPSVSGSGTSIVDIGAYEYTQTASKDYYPKSGDVYPGGILP